MGEPPFIADMAKYAMSAPPAEVKQGEFCSPLLEALNDGRRVSALGWPEEQMEVLGHQDPSEDAKVMLLAKLSQSSGKVELEALGVEDAVTAIGAGGEKMGVV